MVFKEYYPPVYAGRIARVMLDGYLITDLFERIVLYDLQVDAASAPVA